MATSYGERRSALTRMQVTLQTARDQTLQAATTMKGAKVQLDGLPTALKTMLDDIEADAGGELANQVMASEAKILLTEVAALSKSTDAKVKAMEAAA